MAIRLSWLALLSACTSLEPTPSDPSTASVDRLERNDSPQHNPYYARGVFGRATDALEAATAERALAAAMPAIFDTLELPRDLEHAVTSVTHDQRGMSHVKFATSAHGLPIIGGELVVHVDASGVIRSLTSSARDVSALPSVATNRVDGATRLVYVISTRDLQAHLAWEVPVVQDGLLVDLEYRSALGDGSEVIDRRPQVFTARNRTVFDGKGGTFPFVQGTQVGTENNPPSDTVARAAFDNTGLMHDCYSTLYGRDSYDGQGGTLRSLVHVKFFTPQGATGNNAAWTGDQMVYGDGDGQLMSPLALAFDVTAHELTHGVTSSTANLAYQNESGALNEGMSDIMASVCEAWHDGAVSADTWLVGEDIFTPGTAGDALRYMADPTADASLYPPELGGSRDFYADRYMGDQDNGGVHLNSGIANLAFNLLVVGGKHPRNKTPFTVPAIGIEKAGAIFESALVNGHFTSTTNFAQARTATEEVADQMFPGTKTAVSIAWAAVGVGQPPADNTPPTVEIVSPASGANVAAGFTVDVNASDDQVIARVELTIDGMMVGSLTAAPYTFTAPTTLSVGSHTVTATAYDAFQSATDSISVNVTCSGVDCANGGNPDNGEGGGCGCATGGSRDVVGGLLVIGCALAGLRRRRRV